ncbi:MAG: TrbG/VirB9 family P-type conjugative transfer protein [Rubrivivax sp.]
MKAPCLYALLPALLAVPWAQADDLRIRTVEYSPDAVVRVAGREGFQSSIVFGDDEKIENVAVGDSLGWQVTPNKRANLLFLKPMPRGTATNMTVVTDKRVYLFDLEPAAKAAPALYSLRFARSVPAPAPPPPEPPAVAPAPAEPVVPPAPQRVAEDWRARAAKLSFAWRQEGAPRLRPAHVFDDGESVYLDWQPQAPLPAILAAGPDGSEGPVNYVVQGNTLIVDGPVQRLVLRVGKEAAVLTRLPDGAAPAVARATPVAVAGNDWVGGP